MMHTHAMTLGWVPHKPETWTARYGDLKNDVKMSYCLGVSKNNNKPILDEKLFQQEVR